MQQIYWTRTGSCTTDLVFDLLAPANYTINTSGTLAAGRYWLHFVVTGYGMEGGGGASHPSLTLTVPSAARIVCGLGGIVAFGRR